MKRTFFLVALFVSCIGVSAQTPQTPVRRATAVVDLNLFTAPELRIYSASCDSMINAALARGDTENALGWAKVRSEVAIRLNSLEAVPSKPPTRELPPKRYFRVKKKEVVENHKPKETPSPVQAGPTPTMDELVRQYRALKEKN